jgi:hypothetical protein
MFFFFDLMGPLLAVLAAGGNVPNDLVSLVRARDYFQARNVEVNADKMTALAGKAPTDAKESVAQLLAIRWLGEHPAEAKKAKGAVDTLRQVAAGDKDKDRLGFARDYARRALARLEGKAAPARTMPANSIREGALEWFPKNSSIFGGLELRPAEAMKGEPDPTLRLVFGTMMPERARKEMYDFIDKVGNIRVDRASFAVIAKDGDQDTRLYVRITGLADRKRLVALIQEDLRGGGEVKEQKGPNGEPITILNLKKNGPAIAFIGDTDLIFGGYPEATRREDHVRVIEEMLQVRAGKQPNLLKGAYAGTLKNSPARAQGLLIGDLPERWRSEVTGRGSPFRAMPQDFNLSWTRTAKGLEVRFTGNGANAKEAKAFVESVDQLREQAIKGLKELPDRIKVDAKTVATITAALKGVKVEAQDALLAGKATFSPEALKAVSDLVQTAAKWEMERRKPK